MHKPCPQIQNMIIRLSNRYSFSNVSLEDIRQEGWLTVYENKDKWINIPEKERSDYLSPFVRRAMLDYSVAHCRIVKMIVKRSQMKAFCNIRKYSDGMFSLKDVKAQEISIELNVSVSDVKIAFLCLCGNDLSVSANGRVRLENEKEIELPLESSLSNTSERTITLKNLFKKIKELKKTHFNIISLRWLEDKKKTLSRVATEVGLSLSGVAFLEKEAISILRSSMYEMSDAIGNIDYFGKIFFI